MYTLVLVKNDYTNNYPTPIIMVITMMTNSTDIRKYLTTFDRWLKMKYDSLLQALALHKHDIRDHF